MRDFNIALLGLLAGLLLSILLPVRWGGALLMAVVFLPWVVFVGWRAQPGWIAVGILLGLVSQSLVVAARPAIEPAEPVTMIGRVVGLPESAADRQRFLFHPETLVGEALPQPVSPQRIRVSIYGSTPRVAAGERWQLTLKLRRPRGFMNPVRFDYEAWLAARGIDATAYVVDAERAKRLHAAAGLSHWRETLSRSIAMQSGQRGQGSALLQGLIAGDRRGFSDTTWEVLRVTGTSHLFAISGLHIGLAAGLGYFLGRLLWRWLRLPGQKHQSAVLAAAIVASGYAAMAGFALPTQRALFMFLIFALASLLARQRFGLTALLLAAVCLLLIDPAAAIGASFWLSFTAVLLILLVGSRLQRSGGVRGLIHLQVLLTIGLAPLTAVFFGQWSPLGLPVNLVMLPVFSMLIVPLALLSTALSIILPPFGSVLLSALAGLLDWLLMAGEWLLEQGFTPIATTSLSLLGFIAAAAGIGLMLLPGGLSLRWFAAPLLAPVLLGTALATEDDHRLQPGQATITWLEVGQGNAAVIQTRSEVVVIDTGPAWGKDSHAAAFTLIPFLKQQGIAHIDRLIITHADRDHRGGVNALEAAFSVGDVWVGEPIDAFPQQRFCQAGITWEADAVDFAFLWPPQAGKHEGNNASCVLRVRVDGHTVVFTGDIDKTVERRLARWYQAPVDIIEAPHHGSDTSTGRVLLNAWRPRHVVVSAGYRNPYGMPHRSVLRRVRCHGARLHDLGLSGALEVRLTPGEPLQFRHHRPSRSRLLHEPRSMGRFREGREIHYHQRFIATSPTEAGRPACGN